MYMTLGLIPKPSFLHIEINPRYILYMTLGLIPMSHFLTARTDPNVTFGLCSQASLIHTILTEMEKRWPLELGDVELDNFTTKYIPCVKCMNTDMTWTQVFRCRHTTECQHLEEDDCQQFTTPSVSISKIGNKNIAKSLLSFV